MMSWKNRLLDVIKCCISALMVAFGITLFLEIELGADTITVFLDGMNRSFGVPTSVTNQCLVGIIFILAFLLNRKAVGLTTIVYVLIIGTCMELSTQITSPWQLADHSMPSG